MSISRQFRLAARPVGKVKSSDWDLVEVEVPEPADVAGERGGWAFHDVHDFFSAARISPAWRPMS